MSKFDKCVQAAIDAGTLSPKMAEALRVDAEVFGAKLRAEGIYSEAQAKMLGAEAAAKHRTEIAKRNKYHKVLQHTINTKNVENMNAHTRSKMAGLMSLLVKDRFVHKGETAWSNIDNRATAIEGQAHSLAADMLEALHTKKLGLSQDRETLLATVRELFGESTGNPKASKSAKAFAKSAEYLRERYNRAGGFIPKREDWGMPQMHNQAKVAKAGEADWIAFVKGKLNRDAMLDPSGRIMTDEELDDSLLAAYKSISTGGLNKKVAGQFKGAGKLANRHQDSRFLVFQDADSWLSYQERFGEADLFNVMTGHIRGMSSEIAMLEVLGPNPHYAFSYLSDIAEGTGSIKTVESVWNVVNGSTDMVDVSREKFAKGMAVTRHMMMASQLGSATLSAMTDPVYGKMTRAFNGMPITKAMQHTLSQLNPADEGDRAFAAHMGMVMDSWTSQALSGARFSGEIDAAGAASKISEVVFRASGLTAWTAGQRNAFGLDFQWHLGRQMDKPLADVETKFQATMRRYGITDDEWEIMRSAELESHGNAKYFRPQNLHDLDLPVAQADTITTKILEAMNTEMDFAVPVPDARVRAITTIGGHAKGSVAGEASRMFMMYKSFSITQFMTHMHRSGPKFAGVYAIRLGLALTLMGAFSLQSKEISKGREPRDWTTKSFWLAAAMQGGGAGIFGDFITQSGIGQNNRFGHSPVVSALGPAAGLVDDVFTLAGSGFDWVMDPLTGEETNFGREFVRQAKRHVPAQNIWWARTFLERTIWDNLQKMADPKAEKNWRKFEKKRKTEHGQDYIWKHGDTLPQF